MAARFIGSLTSNDISTLKTYSVASGVTINDGDYVYLVGGRISSATITGSPRIIGVYQGPQVTGNASGTVTGIVNVDQNALFLVQTNSGGTLTVGAYYALTGASGAQQVNTTTTYANSGVVTCVELGNGAFGTDTTYGIFKTVNHAFLPYVANV